MQQDVIYRDFRNNFNIHPIKGDLALVENSTSIGQRLRNLIRTGRYERFWDPEKGAGIPQTMFELLGTDTQHLLEAKIREVATNYEPAAEILEVGISPSADLNAYICKIVYRPINQLTPDSVDVIFKRVR